MLYPFTGMYKTLLRLFAQIGIFICYSTCLSAQERFPAPAETVSITSLGYNAGNGTVANVELLGSKVKVKWTQNNNTLLIGNIAAYPSQSATAFRITLRHLN